MPCAHECRQMASKGPKAQEERGLAMVIWELEELGLRNVEHLVGWHPAHHSQAELKTASSVLTQDAFLWLSCLECHF